MSEPDMTDRSAQAQPPHPPQPTYPAQPAPPHPVHLPAYGVAQLPVAAPHPGFAPPPQGYGPYIAPAALPPGARAVQPAGRRTLGFVALMLSLAAAVIAPIVGGVATFNIGIGLMRAGTLRSLESMTESDINWSLLTPVREWILLTEVAFWSGTVLGIWAIVQGIVAIAKRRGRGAGIAAVIVAVVGPVIFSVVLSLLVTAGFGAGA